jgi:hypothetical protein
LLRKEFDAAQRIESIPKNRVFYHEIRDLVTPSLLEYYLRGRKWISIVRYRPGACLSDRLRRATSAGDFLVDNNLGNAMRTPILILFISIVVSGGQAQSIAHDVFKEPMEEKYQLKTVSCKACHPNNKDRSIHNKLGKLLEAEFKRKGLEMTKKYEEAKAQGADAQAAYEKQMINAFTEAMLLVEKQPLTIEDLILSGLLNGTRPKDEKD